MGSPMTFSNSADAFTGLATYQGNVAIGTNSGTQVREITIQLSGQYSLYVYDLAETGFVMADDTTGNLYSGNIDSTLLISVANTGQTKTLAELGFFPSRSPSENCFLKGASATENRPQKRSMGVRGPKSEPTHRC